MNIRIKDIAVTCGGRKVNNDELIVKFKEKYGKDIKALLRCYGRKQRFMIENSDDTTLSLGIKSAQMVLEKSNLKGEDIDIILFSSQFPEYTCPTQALAVHKAIKGKREALVMDINVNCIGMIASVDTAVRYLKEKKKFKRALVIGADYITINCNEYNEKIYPICGDCGCAVILEKDEGKSGFLGSSYRTDGSECMEYVRFPACGLSESYNMNDPEKRKLIWKNFNTSFVGQCARNAILEVVEFNKLKLDDIKLFCITQFAFPLFETIRTSLELPKDKFIYIGDQYGYTGTSSPFLALYEGIKQGKIHRGEYVAFWSVGIYWTTCAMLFKY